MQAAAPAARPNPSRLRGSIDLQPLSASVGRLPQADGLSSPARTSRPLSGRRLPVPRPVTRDPLRGLVTGLSAASFGRPPPAALPGRPGYQRGDSDGLPALPSRNRAATGELLPPPAGGHAFFSIPSRARRDRPPALPHRVPGARCFPSLAKFGSIRPGYRHGKIDSENRVHNRVRKRSVRSAAKSPRPLEGERGERTGHAGTVSALVSPRTPHSSRIFQTRSV